MSDSRIVSCRDMSDKILGYFTSRHLAQESYKLTYQNLPGKLTFSGDDVWHDDVKVGTIQPEIVYNRVEHL